MTQTESLASRGRDFTETLQQIERELREKADMEKRLQEYRESIGLGPASVDPEPQMAPVASQPEEPATPQEQ